MVAGEAGTVPDEAVDSTGSWTFALVVVVRVVGVGVHRRDC